MIAAASPYTPHGARPAVRAPERVWSWRLSCCTGARARCRLSLRECGSALVKERILTMPKTVLVVNDDQAILTYLRDALEAEGYRVLTAIDGAALTAAEQDRPDVIVLDLVMPKMDGLELTYRLRRNPATATIPLILSSAYDRLRPIPPDLPVDDVLPKPYGLAALYEKVACWVARTR